MTRMSLTETATLLRGELSGTDASFAAVSTDTRRLQPGDLFIALRGANHDGHDFVRVARDRGACAALVSRLLDTDLAQIRVDDTRLALGRLAAVWRSRFHNPLLALTGSNGKTTVKEMIAAILRSRGPVLATQGNLNNDIGVPLTLLRLNEEFEYAVVEMGASHLGEIAYLTRLARPDVALVNNAGPAHLEGFGSIDGVARGKGEIFQGLAPNGIAIINRDDRYADYWAEKADGNRVIDFGLDRPARVSGRLLDGQHNCLRLRAFDQTVDIQLPLPGRHNARNALAAAAAGLAIGASLADVRAGLEGMQGVSGRLQHLKGPRGSVLINDAYNANPASLAAALNVVAAYQGDKWLVLGDMGELGPQTEALHTQAGEQARQSGFQRLYSLGEYSRRAAAAFGAGAVHCETVEALVQELGSALREAGGEATLLIKGSRSMRMERVIQGLMAVPEAGEQGVSPRC